ncbi:TonB-dependent receptor [Fulvimonas soli]|jgi:TonB-dependent receptor|uniref:TonB-dependent receptor n=1 Tax=Fulvimonas soli TaxID=155197 RepID=A0A316IYU9_9GAMM|nr:TonB-dependent receptor [Fulvimonas soli]PWK92425.1 TonB-dependent receptor [Fulvimonas soli]TNY25486.1 TonB-dependent receptor [Fulvimonas soli]
MNRKRIHLTLLATMIAASLAAAHAADSPPSAAPSAADAPPQDTTPQPQAAPKKKAATATETSAQNAVNLSGVVVTPLRESLQSAQTIKQDARMIVDSIVAEDIGKLPDNSVADAMQRITGVQIAQGFQGETSSVVIRGLPNVITTLNGREIFSGVGRAFAFQNLPATAVKTVQVYKTSEASLPDGGIAGLVDMQLYRPFDFDGAKAAVTATGTHSKYGGHTDPNLSVLLSDRWQTGIGEIGALFNMGFMGQHYDYNAVWGDFPKLLTGASGDPIRTADGNLIAAPNGWGADYNIGNRQREEMNYALQWKPNDSTEVYLEGLYDWDSDDYNQPFYFSFPVGAVDPTNLTVTGHCYPNQLTGSPYYGQTICDAASGSWTGNTYAATSTQAHEEWGHDIQNSIGVKWHGDRLRLSTDLSFNSTSFHEQTFIVDTFLKAPITTVWSGTHGDQQNWTLAGNPQLDPANYYLNGLFQTWNDQRGKQVAWRGDGNYDIDGSFFQYLDFGLRYSDHKAEYHGSVEISTPPPGGTGDISLNPNPANQVIARFPNGYFCRQPTTSAIPVSWLSGCYDFLVDNADAIRQLYGLPPGLAPENPGRYYHIDEKSYAGYFQAAYGNELFGLPFDGLMGMRVERVKRNLDAFSYDASTNLYTPLSASTSKPVYLPNLSFNLHFTDSLQLRLVAAKTLTYPDFGQLNPSLSLNPGTINRAGIASSGNPDLKPVRSNNYDASLEWYFAPASYLSGGVFYRDIDGYIQNYVTDVTIGGQPYQLNSPQSAGSGHLDGAEVAYQQFFDFLPGAWSGLGVQLNYTYIEGSTRSPQYIGGPVVVSPLQNVSRNNGNAVLMYEKYGWSARLAYNYRSRFIDGFNQPTVAGVNDEIKPANQVDFSLGYDVNPNCTVVLNATNIFGADLHQFWGDGDTRPRDIRYQDRTVGLGVRFKM